MSADLIPLPASGHVVLETVEDTEAFGRRLAHSLSAGDLVVLAGPLGAGKTALSRGIAAGLGVQGRVTSPTFVIARAHRPGVRPGGGAAVGMVHVDAYRLGDSGPHALDELDALDLDTDLAAAVVVVEWGEGIVEQLAEKHLRITLNREPDSDVRTARWEWVS